MALSDLNHVLLQECRKLPLHPLAETADDTAPPARLLLPVNPGRRSTGRAGAATVSGEPQAAAVLRLSILLPISRYLLW